MSAVVRISATVTNQIASKALGFAIDPSNYNIVYLPLGWTVEFGSETLVMIYDTSRTHRATYCHTSETLCVADDYKEATLLKVQLDSARRQLIATQDMLDILSRRVQMMDTRLELWKDCFWRLVEKHQHKLPQIQYHRVY